MLQSTPYQCKFIYNIKLQHNNNIYVFFYSLS